MEGKVQICTWKKFYGVVSEIVKIVYTKSLYVRSIITLSFCGSKKLERVSDSDEKLRQQ